MATIAQTITAEHLFEMPGQDRFELVQGELAPRSPPGFDHGCIVLDIAAALREFVQSRKLGLVAVEAGFCVARDPDTVRSPDVAFVRAERIPPGGVRAFFQARSRPCRGGDLPLRSRQRSHLEGSRCNRSQGGNERRRSKPAWPGTRMSRMPSDSALKMADGRQESTWCSTRGESAVVRWMAKRAWIGSRLTANGKCRFTQVCIPADPIHFFAWRIA